MPRLSRLIGIAALAGALAAGVAAAQQPRSVKLVYDVHFSGIRIGEAKLEGAIGEDAYHATSKLRTAGVVDAFFTADVDSETEGVLSEDGVLAPTRYRADARSSENDQMVEMVYEEGAPRISAAVPAFKKKSYEIVPEEQVGAVDPLSAALQAFAPAPADQVCHGRIEVFDGRKLWALDFSNPRVDGDKMRCDGIYERLAGFKPKYMKRQTKFPFELEYSIDGQGVAMVQRVTVETDYGYAVAKLREASGLE